MAVKRWKALLAAAATSVFVMWLSFTTVSYFYVSYPRIALPKDEPLMFEDVPDVAVLGHTPEKFRNQRLRITALVHVGEEIQSVWLENSAGVHVDMSIGMAPDARLDAAARQLWSIGREYGQVVAIVEGRFLAEPGVRYGHQGCCELEFDVIHVLSASPPHGLMPLGNR